MEGNREGRNLSGTTDLECDACGEEGTAAVISGALTLPDGWTWIEFFAADRAPILRMQHLTCPETAESAA